MSKRKDIRWAMTEARGQCESVLYELGRIAGIREAAKIVSGHPLGMYAALAELSDHARKLKRRLEARR